MNRPTITLSDLKLRIFLDTNILIDAFVTVKQKEREFLDELYKNPNIDLTTSDLAMWEVINFIRKEEWLRICLNTGESYKKALNNNINIDEEFTDKLENRIRLIKKEISDMHILLYDTMDNENKGFFEIVQKFLIHSCITNQDVLILASAYCSKSHIMLTGDTSFKKETEEIKKITGFIEKLPIKNEDELSLLSAREFNYNANEGFRKWFIDYHTKNVIGKITRVFQQNNVVMIKCKNNFHIEVGDYIVITAFNDKKDFMKYIFQVDKDHLEKHNSRKKITSGQHVTIKLPPGKSCEAWMNRKDVFILEK